MGFFRNFWKRDVSIDEARTLVWDFYDKNPNGTLAQCANEINLSVDTCRAHYRNWERARSRSVTETRETHINKPVKTYSNEELDLMSKQNEVAIAKLKIEQTRLEKELKLENDNLNKHLEVVKLDAEIKIKTTDLERLKKDLDQIEDEIKDAKEELDEVHKACDDVCVNASEDSEGGMMEQLFSGLMQGMQNKAQTPPPPVQNPPQTVLTPSIEEKPLNPAREEAIKALSAYSEEQKAQFKALGKTKAWNLAKLHGGSKEAFEEGWKILNEGEQ